MELQTSKRFFSDGKPATVESFVPAFRNGFHSQAPVTRLILEEVAGRQVCHETAEKIQPCLDYMRQKLDQPLRVSTLSSLLGVSPSHFFYLFKRATGFSPIDFFIRLRMHRAAELLRQTKLSVKEISAVLGYNDQFYLCRLFKSVYGVPPTGYRAVNKPGVNRFSTDKSSCSALRPNGRRERALPFDRTGPLAHAPAMRPVDSLALK